MGACCAPGNGLPAIVGTPTWSLARPGQCQIEQEPSLCILESRTPITHDTFVVTFKLPDPSKPLGLSTCACLLACWSRGLKYGATVIRPYTPISTNELVGKFQLLVKRYPGGLMSNRMWELPEGQGLMFKHIDQNVKKQYPFHAKHITMLVGGTGINPMIQALHAILGNPADTTKVNLIFGNKTQEDMLANDLLDSWARNSGGRLEVTHILSGATDDSSWYGLRGFISKELIQAKTPPFSEDPLIMVCGPPPMYNALCGPREENDVTGILGSLGYKTHQVYKF